MANSRDQLKLPRAPLAPEEAEARLPWAICGLTVGAAIIGGAIALPVYSWCLTSRLAYMPGLPGFQSKMLISYGASWLWTGLKIGSGAAVADRVAPREWSRPLRWGAGIGIAALIPRPDLAYKQIEGLASGGGWSPTLTVVAGMVLMGAFWSAVLGAWLGSASRGRRLAWCKLALVGATVWAARYVAEFIASDVRRGQFGPPEPMDPAVYWTQAAASLGVMALCGALMGMAFALALWIGGRRRDGAAR